MSDSRFEMIHGSDEFYMFKLKKKKRENLHT